MSLITMVLEGGVHEAELREDQPMQESVLDVMEWWLVKSIFNLAK